MSYGNTCVRILILTVALFIVCPAYAQEKGYSQEELEEATMAALNANYSVHFGVCLELNMVRLYLDKLFGGTPSWVKYLMDRPRDKSEHSQETLEAAEDVIYAINIANLRVMMELGRQLDTINRRFIGVPREKPQHFRPGAAGGGGAHRGPTRTR
jgi:hypothetical protein